MRIDSNSAANHLQLRERCCEPSTTNQSAQQQHASGFLCFLLLQGWRQDTLFGNLSKDIGHVEATITPRALKRHGFSGVSLSCCEHQPTPTAFPFANPLSVASKSGYTRSSSRRLDLSALSLIVSTVALASFRCFKALAVPQSLQKRTGSVAVDEPRVRTHPAANEK